MLSFLLKSEQLARHSNLKPTGSGTRLEILVVVLGKRLRGGLRDFLLVLTLGGLVDGELGRLQGGSLDKVELVVSTQLAGEPEERLLKVVVRLCGNVVVLQILLSVEGNLLGLDLAVFDLDLVARQDDGNILTDSREITVPVGHVLVGDTRRDIEHDNGALALNVVAVTETSKFLEEFV